MNTSVQLGGLIAIFAIVTLPVELEAPTRAEKLLHNYNIVDKQELAGVNSGIDDAAWTYVVAALSAIVEVTRWVLILLTRE